jgi:hypothetical protein
MLQLWISAAEEVRLIVISSSCIGAARPRCVVAPGAPLERTPPASPPRFSRVVESLHLVG